MTDERTVRDALHDFDLWEHTHLAPVILIALDIDPDMPFEQFARWLRYGKKADELGEADADAYARGDNSRYFGYTDCLDAIKDDDA